MISPKLSVTPVCEFCRSQYPSVPDRLDSKSLSDIKICTTSNKVTHRRLIKGLYVTTPYYPTRPSWWLWRVSSDGYTPARVSVTEASGTRRDVPGLHWRGTDHHYYSHRGGVDLDVPVYGPRKVHGGNGVCPSTAVSYRGTHHFLRVSLTSLKHFSFNEPHLYSRTCTPTFSVSVLVSLFQLNCHSQWSIRRWSVDLSTTFSIRRISFRSIEIYIETKCTQCDELRLVG